ncbi:MFS transporter [Brevibacillus massiliensis]|jgi:putative MFS transporter|uniref:MFS transporter n=1 Tax=Brevibacillus massiliensis TaxID=1118054 RepID=UPI000305F6F5|nr:MFS transporter [Brevibacillus massiliensis]
MSMLTSSSTSQRKLLFSAGLSWLFDAMDVGIISFIVAALTVAWNLTPQQVGWLTGINSIGMAVGAALAGILADRYGRKNVLIATLLVFSVATGLSALAHSFLILCVLRFVAGVGLGGELPVASTLVSESMPAAKRGQAVVLLESFWAGGWLLAALVAYFVIPVYGWQSAFAIGAIPVLYALYLRRSIEDSPRHIAVRGRGARSFAENLASIWKREHRRSTMMLWILWFTVVFSYYGMFLWLPTVMVMKGFSLIKSFEYVLIMTLAQLPGYFTAAYFIERYGRKFVLVLYLTMTALAALWFGNAGSLPALLASGIFLSFFNLGAWGGLYAYTPELYPTAIRSTGAGMAASIGRVGGIAAPLLVGVLVAAKFSIAWIFTMFFSVILIGVLAVAFLGPETRLRELVDE